MIINGINSNLYNYTGLSKMNNFKAEKEQNSRKILSLREADNLKYEVEYNKVARLKNDVNIVGDNINIYFRPGLNGTKVDGVAYNHVLNLEYVCKGFNPNKMGIKGRIDNKDISIKSVISGNNVTIEGDTSNIDNETMTLLNMLSRDFTEVTANQINLATMFMLS